MIQIERIGYDIDQETFVEVGAFLNEHSKELVAAPVDLNIATENLYAALADSNLGFVAYDGKTIVGVLVLIEQPLSWAADPVNRCLVDFTYVVAKDRRNDGIVDRMLRDAAIDDAEEAGLPVFIWRRIPLGRGRDKMRIAVGTAA